MVARIALRQTGKRVKAYLTTAGSVEAGRRLAQHPVARQAQSCIASNHGNKTAIRKCMAGIKRRA